jgi:hypothetical protein
MKKLKGMKKQFMAIVLAFVLTTGSAGAIGEIYKTYDPQTGKFSATGSPLVLNLDNAAEVARSYNPSIRASIVQADQVEKMTAWGGMYPDRVVANANANFYSLESAVGKMAYGAQTMLYSYYSLENSIKTFTFDIGAMERNERKMAKLFELGMISENEYIEFSLSAREAKAALDDMIGQRDNLFAQIAAYVSRAPGQITIEDFALLSDTEMHTRFSNLTNSEYADATRASRDILAAYYAHEAAYENDYDDVITSLNLLSAENNHQMSYESLLSNATLLGEKVKIANERYKKAEKVFAISERRYQLGELSTMDYMSAQEQLDKDYITMMGAHIAFDMAYRKFMTLVEEGILLP